MTAFDWLTPQTRVLDIGVSDPAVAHDLAERGVSRYLGLAHRDALAHLRSGNPDLAHRFHELASPQSAIRASTDLLTLRGGYERLLWATRDLTRVRHVAVEKMSGISGVERAAATVLGVRARKFHPQGTIHLGGSEFELLSVKNPARPSPRRYFSPAWGPTELAERLAAANLDYVVLRWFDSLPIMEPGEDLDILVADHHLADFQALLEEEPGTIPIDLYSVSGLPASDYQKAAYYPPALAREILSTAQTHASGFRVPSATEHLRSLAYHAVYHKGPRSGIPSDRAISVADPEHNYQQVLTTLARTEGIVSIPATLEEWDDYLASVVWRPSPDAMRKLGPSNPWIAAGADEGCQPAAGYGELAVFLVREETLKVLELAEVLAVLDHFGFDVLAARELSAEGRARCESAVRGGNWGRGPYPRSGGPPSVLVAALHYAPAARWEAIQERYPHLTNADVLRAKLRLRDLVQASVPKDYAFNPAHSADNESEAYEYLAAGAPELLPHVRIARNERASHVAPDVPVLQPLSMGRRSRVDIVRGENGPVVRKTYYPHSLRHLNREIGLMEELHGKVDAVPPVLSRGPNWFTSPYYSNTLGQLVPGKLVPLPILRDMVRVLSELHDRGFDLVDAQPKNFLNDPNEGLKVIDFEFAYEYAGGLPPLADSMNFCGTPSEYEGDYPVGDHSYERCWLPYAGVPLEVLVYGSPHVQRAYRVRFKIAQATIAQGSPLRRPLGKTRRSVRRLRGAASARYARLARRRAGLPS